MRQDLKYKLDTLLQLLQKEEFKITYQTKNVTHFFFFLPELRLLDLM